MARGLLVPRVFTPRNFETAAEVRAKAASVSNRLGSIREAQLKRMQERQRDEEYEALEAEALAEYEQMMLEEGARLERE